MENEIKLVNEVQGSVLTDNVVERLDKRAADMAEVGRVVGNLEGELKVANQLIEQNIKDTDRKLQEAQTEVRVVVETKGQRIYDNEYGLIYDPTSLRSISIPRTDLGKLADTAVKAQALKDVKAAEEVAEVAKKQKEAYKEDAKKTYERAKKLVEDKDKEVSKKIESAIERAEKQNTRKISELELDVKALTKEADLLLDEKENLARERDLALEAQEAKIAILNKRIELLEKSPSTWLETIGARLMSWRFTKKLQRLNV